MQIFFAIMLAFFPLKLASFVNIPNNLFLNIVLAIFIFSFFTFYLQCIRHVCSTGNRSCDMLNWNIYSVCKQLLSCAQSFPSLHRRQTIRKSRLQFVLLLHFRCGTSFSALSVCNQLLLSLLLLLCTSLTFSFLQWQIEKAIQTNPIAKPPEKEREREGGGYGGDEASFDSCGGPNSFPPQICGDFRSVGNAAAADSNC